MATNQFVEFLGKGGFGVVYKVWSLSKSCYEAMKILEVRSGPSSEALAAFKHEIQRMANVPGAHVAHVHHVGELPDKRPFFTMEFLNGGRLDHYCARRRASIDDRIHMMAGVCDGVHHLHELNLVHCDLKPRNILIAENAGTAVAKVVDFGLARHMQGGSSPKRTAGGTLQYMSPEQLEARSGDPERSWDVYSLGVTLYELLVGECPIDPSFEAAEALEFEKAARLRDRIKQLKELPEMSQSRHR